MISTYKITNHVLDELDLTNSFNFFTTNAITSSSNIEKRELHQRNYIPMIAKIYIEKGAKTKGVGGIKEERTNPYKNYTLSQQEF